MSKVLKKACAGNEAQNADCVVTIEPNESGIEFSLDSLVKTQYGKAIEKSTYDELKKYGITDCHISIVDRGAIDCVLRARLEAAIKRSMEA